MTLFSSIQMGKNALFAAQIGMHVVGNNIANVNTPGYVRQDVLLAPSPTMRLGKLLLGTGVEVQGVIQRSDRFLDEQVRDAISDLANGEAQEQAYVQLEGLLGELTDTDLSTSFTAFFNSIHDILNQPESIANRNLAVLQGLQLTHEFRQLASRTQAIRQDLNNRVVGMADRINQLLTDIARLNVQITMTEGGEETRTSTDAALRRERSLKLAELAEIIDIRTEEQTSGGMAVYAGGDQVVYEGTARQVKVEYSQDRGMNIARIELTETNSPVRSTSGELAGLITARDEIVAGFADQLDDIAQTLIFEFNKIYSGGQGLVGLDSVTSEFTVDSSGEPLDAAGLTYVPETGSFQVLVRNKLTGITKTTDLFVELNGFDDDTTLNDLTSALDAIEGISAQITSAGQLVIGSESPDVEFAFRQDTSGVLAALGINTFFTGISAGDISVHADVQEEPALFAASRDGIGVDTENAVILAAFFDMPLESKDGESLAVLQERLTTETSQATALAKSLTDGFRVYHDSLEGRQLALGGVNIDEEIVRLLMFQRAFQANARFIAAVDEALEYLVNL